VKSSGTLKKLLGSLENATVSTIVTKQVGKAAKVKKSLYGPVLDLT